MFYWCGNVENIERSSIHKDLTLCWSMSCSTSKSTVRHVLKHWFCSHRLPGTLRYSTSHILFLITHPFWFSLIWDINHTDTMEEGIEYNVNFFWCRTVPMFLSTWTLKSTEEKLLDHIASFAVRSYQMLLFAYISRDNLMGCAKYRFWECYWNVRQYILKLLQFERMECRLHCSR